MGACDDVDVEPITNVMILLLGFPGTGKLTTAIELCKVNNFKLIDNQTINRPIFKMLDINRETPIPPKAWAMVDRVRDTVFQALVEVANPESNFIFTFYADDQDEKDHRIYSQFLETARKRKAYFFPVRLEIAEEENKRRIVSEGRAVHMKDMSIDNTSHRHAHETVLETGHENELTIDVTELQPEETAAQIMKHIKTVVEAHG